MDNQMFLGARVDLWACLLLAILACVSQELSVKYMVYNLFTLPSAFIAVAGVYEAWKT